jgi:MFS family permease
MWAIFLSAPTAASSSQHPPIHFTGGLGMTPRSVGFAMSLLGAIGVILQAVLYPSLNDKFGTVRIWRASLFIFPFVYLLAPFPALVASAADIHGEAKTALTWVATVGVLFLYIMGRTGTTPATTLLINDCTPHPSVRGTIHTIATVVGNLSRSIFPITAFAILGYGLKIGVVGLGFWCIMFLAMLACVASRWVIEGTNGKEIVLEEEDEEEVGEQRGSQRQR